MSKEFRGIVNGKIVKVDPDAFDCYPWRRGWWAGSIVAVGECSTADFERADVVGCAVYCEFRDSPSTGIAWLSDGRVIGWEAWECTSSMFSGDDIIYVASSVDLVVRGLSEESRDALTPLFMVPT